MLCVSACLQLCPGVLVNYWTTMSALYKCDICFKTFTRNSNLRRHVKQQHTNVTVPERLQVGRKSRSDLSKRINCAFCKQTFSSRQSYYRHRKVQHQHQRQPARSNQRFHNKNTVVKLHFNSLAGK